MEDREKDMGKMEIQGPEIQNSPLQGPEASGESQLESQVKNQVEGNSEENNNPNTPSPEPNTETVKPSPEQSHPTPPRRTLLDMNLSKIKKLLYAHPGTGPAIKYLRAQIREIDNHLVRSGVANYNVGSGGSVSTGDIEVMSSPEMDTEKRLRSKGRLQDRIIKLQARYEAIREAVNLLGGKKERIIRVKYFENWESQNPGSHIHRELGMRKENYLKWEREALEYVGRFIGEWVDPRVRKEAEGDDK